MDDIENERHLREKYPLHIVLMVRAAVAAMDEGRARIEDGLLVLGDTPPKPEVLQDGEPLPKANRRGA